MESIRGAVCKTSLDSCKVRTPCHRLRLKTRQFGPSCAWLPISATRGSSALALLPCQFARGSATRVHQHSTSTHPVGAVLEQCQHGTSPSFDNARRVRQPYANVLSECPFSRGSVREDRQCNTDIRKCNFGCLFPSTQKETLLVMKRRCRPKSEQ